MAVEGGEKKRRETNTNSELTTTAAATTVTPQSCLRLDPSRHGKKMAGREADCRGGSCCCACCCKTDDDTKARSRSLADAVPRHIVPVLFSPVQTGSFLCNERTRCSEEPQQHTNNRRPPRFADRQTTKRGRERAHAKGKHSSSCWASCRPGSQETSTGCSRL